MTTTKRGAFIVLEGIDGSGKTTMALRVMGALGGPERALLSGEPFDSEDYDDVRTFSDPVTMALWHAYDRAYHVASFIRPEVNAGRHVISDRYKWSSYAYQGADDCDMNWLEQINCHAPEPDFTVYLDVPVLVAVNRIEAREKRRVDAEEAQRLEQVASIYIDLAAKADVQRAIVIDADRDADAVFADVLEAVETFLETFDGSKPL